MHDGTNQKIISLQLFECGCCVNDFGRAIKYHKNDWRKFGALCVLIKHRDIGYILFDTGYSSKIYDCGFAGKIYCRANPTFVAIDDMLVSKLKQQNILPSDISYCILSHAHPDHIGGMKDFNTTYLMTYDTYLDLQNVSVRNLVFKDLVPNNFAFKLVEETICNSIFDKWFLTYDLFGDMSVLGVYLPGHSKGHMGIYIPEAKVLFAGDASWDYNMLANGFYMKFFAKKLQYDYNIYFDTTLKLFNFSTTHRDIDIIFSHSDIQEGKLWGN